MEIYLLCRLQINAFKIGGEVKSARVVKKKAELLSNYERNLTSILLLFRFFIHLKVGIIFEKNVYLLWVMPR